MDRNIKDLHPELQPLCQQFLDTCHAHGVMVFLTNTYRSSAEQDIAYEQGRSVSGNIITNARGGQSAHNVTLADDTPASCAFDFGIKTDDGQLDWDADDTAWQTAIKIGVGLGLISGSKFHTIVDSPHMELANWKDKS